MNKKIEVSSSSFPVEEIEETPVITTKNFSDSMRYLVGKICTIIDASYDEKKAEAVKTLIKNELYGASDRVYSWREKVINQPESEKESYVYGFPFGYDLPSPPVVK